MLWIQEPCRLVFRTGCRGGNTQEPPSGHVHPGNHRETEHNPVGFSDLIPLSGWLKETFGTSGFCSLGWLMKSLVAFFCGIHFQELLVFLLFYAIDRSSNAEKQCVVYLIFSWWQSFHPTLLLGVRERNCYPVQLKQNKQTTKKDPIFLVGVRIIQKSLRVIRFHTFLFQTHKGHRQTHLLVSRIFFFFFKLSTKGRRKLEESESSGAGGEEG